MKTILHKKYIALEFWSENQMTLQLTKLSKNHLNKKTSFYRSLRLFPFLRKNCSKTICSIFFEKLMINNFKIRKVLEYIGSIKGVPLMKWGWTNKFSRFNFDFFFLKIWTIWRWLVVFLPPYLARNLLFHHFLFILFFYLFIFTKISWFWKM